jgi:hypothetical protein
MSVYDCPKVATEMIVTELNGYYYNCWKNNATQVRLQQQQQQQRSMHIRVVDGWLQLFAVPTPCHDISHCAVCKLS